MQLACCYKTARQVTNPVHSLPVETTVSQDQLLASRRKLLQVHEHFHAEKQRLLHDQLQLKVTKQNQALIEDPASRRMVWNGILSFQLYNCSILEQQVQDCRELLDHFPHLEALLPDHSDGGVRTLMGQFEELLSAIQEQRCDLPLLRLRAWAH